MDGDDAALAAIAESDHVRWRDIGTIAVFLREHFGLDGDAAIGAAKALIAAQVDAGLVTFIHDDLRAFIATIRSGPPHLDNT